MSESISERLDALLGELPEDAWAIVHVPGSDWRVCAIVIDWRLVPGQNAPHLRAVREGKPDA